MTILKKTQRRILFSLTSQLMEMMRRKKISMPRKVKEERTKLLLRLKIYSGNRMRMLWTWMEKTWRRCLSWSFLLFKIKLMGTIALIKLVKSTSIRSKTWEQCKRICFLYILNRKELLRDMRNVLPLFLTKMKMLFQVSLQTSLKKDLRVLPPMVNCFQPFRNCWRRIITWLNNLTNIKSTLNKLLEKLSRPKITLTQSTEKVKNLNWLSKE